MKKHTIKKAAMAVCLMACLGMLPVNSLKVKAAEVIATVEGTVMKGTTSELLLLSTREGKMEIKLDAETDTGECKILLPEKSISVSLSHGADGYLHAVKITSGAQNAGVVIDSSNTATVTGTLGEKTAGDLLYVNTPQGEMEIKLDAATDMSGCKVLVTDKTYSIVCARGSDAYMHALRIFDAASGTVLTGGATGMTPAPAGTVTAATLSVTGTVGAATKENLLYLSTDSGEMQIVIDSNTDSRNGLMLVPGRTLVVAVYHGSDAYMHAASMTGIKNAAQVPELDSSSQAVVTGTVGDQSTENILCLKTPQGDMELKLDTVRNISNCKVLVSGKKLSVTCVRGADAYMHAVDIAGV